jgi:hypothetical protein
MSSFTIAHDNKIAASSMGFVVGQLDCYEQLLTGSAGVPPPMSTKRGNELKDRLQDCGCHGALRRDEHPSDCPAGDPTARAPSKQVVQTFSLTRYPKDW